MRKPESFAKYWLEALGVVIRTEFKKNYER